MMPKVSIVVPCYNGGRFLDRLFASLAAQTFRDFEIVLVDDGSNEPETMAKLESLPPDIRMIRQVNQGLAAARNSGFRAAQGDFVLPLDCDDAIEPEFLARAVRVLDGARADVGFVFSDMRLAGSLSGVLPRRLNRFDQLFLNRLPYSLLLRKLAWEKAGGYDVAMRDGYEDWEFNIRLILAGYTGIRIPEPLFVYTVSPDGMLLSRSARLHGVLWRRMLRKHMTIYAVEKLRELDRLWRDPGRRFGVLTGMTLVWGGWLLPETFVSVVFYHLLQTAHRLRVRRGVLSAPNAELNDKG